MHLSTHIRSIFCLTCRYHEKHPLRYERDGDVQTVDYNPAESTNWIYGGNSNWRGPVWFPTTWLFVESLIRYHEFFSDGLRVECPTGSGKLMTLQEVAWVRTPCVIPS